MEVHEFLNKEHKRVIRNSFLSNLYKNKRYKSYMMVTTLSGGTDEIHFE